MTTEQKSQYEETETLREIIRGLKNRKFKLDCGHYVTFCHFLGNDITIRNYKLKIVCSQCGYEGE